MSWEIEILEDITVEPITLSEVKSWLRIDDDYSSDDDVLTTLITSCREKLEGHLNLYFGVKTVELQLTGNILKLPYGPTGTISYVERVDGDDPYAATEYITRGLKYKTIFIGDNVDDAITWWYPANNALPYPLSGYYYGTGCEPVYNIYYTTGFTTLPNLLKNALLLQIDYEYKNQGKADLKEICPAALMIANTFSKNLPIQ